MELLAKEVARFVKLPGKNFLLVRHGESLANYSGVLHGFSDTKLTIKGSMFFLIENKDIIKTLISIKNND
jgi:bisphosphoglycerate-dependent phosphoglycerate mutase